MSSLLRLVVPDRPGILGAVATALGDAGIDIVSVDVLERGNGVAVDDVVVELPADRLPDSLITAAQSVPGREGGVAAARSPGRWTPTASWSCSRRWPAPPRAPRSSCWPPSCRGCSTAAGPSSCRRRAARRQPWEVAAASDAAPTFDGRGAALDAATGPRLLPSEDEWLPERWREMAIEMMASPYGGPGCAVVLGRSGGPGVPPFGAAAAGAPDRHRDHGGVAAACLSSSCRSPPPSDEVLTGSPPTSVGGRTYDRTHGRPAAPGSGRQPPAVGWASGPLGAVQAADREIARQTALRPGRWPRSPRPGPASADRAPGEPGCMSADRRAARPEVLAGVSEWAAEEVAMALSITTRRGGTSWPVADAGAPAAADPGGAGGRAAARRASVVAAGEGRPDRRRRRCGRRLERDLLAWVAGRQVTTPAQLGAKVRRELLARNVRDAAPGAGDGAAPAWGVRCGPTGWTGWRR